MCILISSMHPKKTKLIIMDVVCTLFPAKSRQHNSNVIIFQTLGRWLFSSLALLLLCYRCSWVLRASSTVDRIVHFLESVRKKCSKSNLYRTGLTSAEQFLGVRSNKFDRFVRKTNHSNTLPGTETYTDFYRVRCLVFATT